MGGSIDRALPAARVTDRRPSTEEIPIGGVNGGRPGPPRWAVFDRPGVEILGSLLELPTVAGEPGSE